MQVLSYVASHLEAWVINILVLIIGIIWGWKSHSIRIEQIRKKEAENKQAQQPLTRRDLPETTQIVNGKRYSSLDSKCIAQGATFWGWAWLMRTNHDNYFLISQALNLQAIFPQTLEEAIAFHTSCTTREVDFREAFPNVKVQDA